MKLHLRMLLKAVEVVAKGIWIVAIILTLLIAYLQYANQSYKQQHGWISHIEWEEGRK